MTNYVNSWPFNQWWMSEAGATCSGEELYRAFKARLMQELAVADQASGKAVQSLVDVSECP